MIMNSAKHIAPRGHQRRLSSVMALRMRVMGDGGGWRGRRRGWPAARGSARRRSPRGRRGGGAPCAPRPCGPRAGGLEALDDLAAVGRDADALHAPVGGVLAAFEPAAAQQPVHRAAGAREREAEAACELLDGHLVGALVERVQRLHLRDRDVEVGDEPVELLTGAPGQVVPELQELRGELLARYLRVSSNCFHVRKYCTCAVVVRLGYPSRAARGT